MRNAVASGDRVVFDACHDGKLATERKMKTSIGSFLGSILFVALVASISQAQSNRTFVSGVGDDSSPCSRTQPCRSFTKAISQTAPGGEVVVLDSGSFDPFSITQAVSIVAPDGVYAGITVRSGDGIDVNVGPSDTVTIRGLNLNGLGTSGNGITFQAGGALRLENCIANGFNSGPNPQGAGVAFIGAANLEVKDSIMRGNFYGIFVKGGAGGWPALAAIDRVRLEGNRFGLEAQDGANVTVHDSLASAASAGGTGFDASSFTGSVQMNLVGCTASNNGNGIAATIHSGSSADVNLESCQVSNNSFGVVADGSQSPGAGVNRLRVSNCTITDNSNIGLYNLGAIVLTRGNNTIEGNQTDVSGWVFAYSAK